MSTRHVDAKTQAVSPESGRVPGKNVVAKLEAAWATRIPEPDMCVLHGKDFGPACSLTCRKDNINIIEAVFHSIRFNYKYEKVHVQLQNRRICSCKGL